MHCILAIAIASVCVCVCLIGEPVEKLEINPLFFHHVIGHKKAIQRRTRRCCIS